MKNLLFLIFMPLVCFSDPLIHNTKSLSKSFYDSVTNAKQIVKYYDDSCFCATKTIRIGNCLTTIPLKNTDIIKPLGSFHETMGVFSIITGASAIIFTIASANQPHASWTPLHSSALISASIPMIFGIWEFKIGHKLKCFKD